MKTFFQTLTLIGLFLFPYANVGIAQRMQGIPQKMLDAAKSQFELAYKAETGELPSEEATASAMKTFKAAIGGLPNSLGMRAGKEAKRLANLRRGFDKLDGLTLIDVLKETEFDSLVGFGFTRAKVAGLAEADMAINQIDGRMLVKDPKLILKLEENTEIFFPQGTYTINEQTLMRILERDGKKFPKGIAFVGEGKNKTTLKLTDARFTGQDVDRLGFRDMTVDCDNDGMFDKRQGSLILRLSNVRLVRFDAGHGGCTLFSINEGLIVHATDTEFIGGFGRSPGRGSIFESCKIFLGHFERCVFTGIEHDLFRSVRQNKACLWMDECQFDRKHKTNGSTELKDCKFDAKAPVIKWSPQKDTEIGEIDG